MPKKNLYPALEIIIWKNTPENQRMIINGHMAVVIYKKKIPCLIRFVDMKPEDMLLLLAEKLQYKVHLL